MAFKKDNVELPNNYVSALGRIVKQNQRFKRDEKFRTDNFNFMGKLFKDGHAVELPEKDFEGVTGKTCYQAHSSVDTSKKIRLVFNCAANI